MSKVNIVGIAPNKNLKLLMDAVSMSYPEVNFTSVLGDLMAGAKALKNFDLEQIDVVISRGGTALLLKKLFNIPVVEINISIYDILRAIFLSKGDKSKKAIVGFSNITEKAVILRDLLELEHEIVTINNKNSAKKILSQLKNEGYHTMISDTVTSVTAAELQLNTILIESNEESLNFAFDRSINIGKAHVIKKHEKNILKELSNYNPHKTIVMDENYNFISNFSTQLLTNKFIKQLQEHFKKNNWKEDFNFQIKHNNSLYSIHYSYKLFLKTSYHVFFAKKSNTISLSDSIIDRYELSSIKKNIQKKTFNIFSLLGNEFQQKVQNFSKTQDPLFIYGKRGTPLLELAKRISIKTSEFNSFWLIDVNKLSDKNWNDLLTSQNSPLMSNEIIICFNNIQSLSRKNWNFFEKYAKDTLLFNRCKLLFIYTLEQTKNEQLFNEMRTYFLNIRIPSVKENISNLYSLITLMINGTNSDYGKNVIGVEPEALELLVKYSWPGNHQQLKNSIKELVLQTEGAFVQKESVVQILNDEEIAFSEKTSEEIFRNKTLEEINYEIIKEVIKKENGNQTKAAEHLQISRSTIWRILNKHSN